MKEVLVTIAFDCVYAGSTALFIEVLKCSVPKVTFRIVWRIGAISIFDDSDMSVPRLVMEDCLL